MTNLEKFNNAFIEVFNVDTTLLNSEFCKDNVNEWDSVHQLSVISILEESFDIMFDPEDIMDFTSYSKGLVIIKKYNIEL